MDGAAAALERLYELVDEIEREHLHDLSPEGRRKIVRAVCSVVRSDAGGEPRHAPLSSPLAAQTRIAESLGESPPGTPDVRST